MVNVAVVLHLLEDTYLIEGETAMRWRCATYKETLHLGQTKRNCRQFSCPAKFIKLKQTIRFVSKC